MHTKHVCPMLILTVWHLVQCCIMQVLIALAYLSIFGLKYHLVGSKTSVEGTKKPLPAVLSKIWELEGPSHCGSKRALNI